MAGWTLFAGLLSGGAAAAGAALALGARAWDRETALTVARLRAPAARDTRLDPGTPYDPAQLSALPAPVARYFAFALTEGQAPVRYARLAQEGTFATARDRWAPFTAVEHFSAAPAGFVWDARIRMAPFVVARVRDSYVGGEGVMHGALAGLVTVVDQRGTPEMAAGSLLRYLAEAAWFPTALLPQAGVRWEAVDDVTARAVLADGRTTVSMDVRFGAGGELERVSAMRHRDVRGTPVPTPWSGRFSGYRRVAGMMVPAEGEVGWELADGYFPYWRGRIVESEFELVRSSQPPPSAA